MCFSPIVPQKFQKDIFFHFHNILQYIPGGSRSLERASWVSGCSAATIRRDIPPAQTTRGNRGSRGSFPTRGTRSPHWKPHRGYLSKTSGGSSRGHIDHGRRGGRPRRGGFRGGGASEHASPLSITPGGKTTILPGDTVPVAPFIIL
jgi:uncharacterized membrane protein YgcG